MGIGKLRWLRRWWYGLPDGDKGILTVVAFLFALVLLVILFWVAKSSAVAG